MTERNEWKPVAHDKSCRMYAIFSCSNDGTKYELPCTCNGTRWSGYGERVGDCAAVYALCAWFGAMREEVAIPSHIIVANLVRATSALLQVSRHACEYEYLGDDDPWTDVSYWLTEAQAMLAAQQPKKEA